MTRFETALAAMALASMSCAPAPKPVLSGEWRFADVRNASTAMEFVSPPLFDILDFHGSGRVTLRDTLRKKSFEGRYNVREATITWVFHPKDVPREIEHRLTYKWDRDGALLLRSAQGKDSVPTDSDWVYFRPQAFVSTEPFVGSWRIVQDGRELQSAIRFASDGAVVPDNKENWGYFRMWKIGKALHMTMVMWVQGEGAIAKVDEVQQLADGSMKLTPTADGPSSPSVWQRVRN